MWVYERAGLVALPDAKNMGHPVSRTLVVPVLWVLEAVAGPKASTTGSSIAEVHLTCLALGLFSRLSMIVK